MNWINAREQRPRLGRLIIAKIQRNSGNECADEYTDDEYSIVRVDEGYRDPQNGYLNAYDKYEMLYRNFARNYNEITHWKYLEPDGYELIYTYDPVTKKRVPGR